MTTAFPADHWAVASGVEATFRALPYAVAVVAVPGPPLPPPLAGADEPAPTAAAPGATRVGVYLNPSDARCYRMLLRPLVPHPAALPFNVFPSMADAAALGVASAAIGDLMWRRCGLYLQTYQLGNNSQTPRDGDGELALTGDAHEPYFAHVHGVWRGNPETAYHPRLPRLGGPPIGEAFPMKAPPGTPHAAKEPWASPAALAAGAQGLRALLSEALAAHGAGVRRFCDIEVLPVEAE